MGRRLLRGPRKKPLHIAGKKLALQRLGKKRLSPTKAERRTRHAMLEQIVGHEIAKLSQVVGNPSRYRKRGTRVITNAEGKIIREEFVAKRVSKSRRGTGSGGGERDDHRTGSSAARVSQSKRLGGKRGMRTTRRDKKRRKKRKKKSKKKR